MTAKCIVGLIEEMMDVKVQQYAETTMRPTPEVARLLQEKRETDRRRLDQIRAELIRILELYKRYLESTYPPDIPGGYGNSGIACR
jgi:hypothetical protein